MIRPGDTVAYRPRPASGWGVVKTVDGDTITAGFYIGYFTDYTGPESDFRLIRKGKHHGNEREYSKTGDRADSGAG